MTDIYLTSTLHNDWNIDFNPKLCAALEERGIRCYLPQRDTDQTSTEAKFKDNLAGIRNAHKLLCVAENESVNWGTEVGYAYAMGKEIIALKKKKHEIPLMPNDMAKEVVEVGNLDEINSYINQLVEKIKK